MAVEFFITELGRRFSNLTADPLWNSLNQTARITEAIQLNAKHTGAKVELEYKTELIRSGFRKTGKPYSKHGHIDAQLTFPDGSCLAIEIDKGNKRWSLAKLEHCVEHNKWLALWIRWRGVLTKDIPKGILVIELSDQGVRFSGETSIDSGRMIKSLESAKLEHSIAIGSNAFSSSP